MKQAILSKEDADLVCVALATFGVGAQGIVPPDVLHRLAQICADLHAQVCEEPGCEIHEQANRAGLSPEVN